MPCPCHSKESPLRTATLDGAAAAVARNAQGQIVLFVRDAGRHRLEVEIQVPVVITAAQQSLQFRVPTAGSSTLKLAVPGNVEVKSGAQVVDRQYDTAADQTRFELLSPDGAVSVVMSLEQSATCAKIASCWRARSSSRN